MSHSVNLLSVPNSRAYGLYRVLMFCALALLLALPAEADDSVLRMATTTSTENSGLLRVLLPPFEKSTGIKVHVIAVGTGKALRLAREGDVDVVLVHAREAEDKLLADGFGVNRRDVMFNDFVIAGPAGDPAGIKGTQDVIAALQRIMASKSLFISRGDNSGTHKKELQLWSATGSKPGGDWYRESGLGMGRVLQMADELGAYTLTDRGTWLAYQDKLQLVLLLEGDRRLYNPYGIIAVNPARYPDIRYQASMRLIAWLTSIPGQSLIRNFRLHGKALFNPLAIPAETLHTEHRDAY